MRYLLVLLGLCLQSVEVFCQYKTVKIGNKVWMAENLNRDIPGSYVYNGQSELAKKYGRLYTWEAARNACPAGWHLPSVGEWDELIAVLGSENIAGKQLKASGSSGFNALFAGYTNGQSFFFLESMGGFWSATEYDNSHAWYYFFTNKNDAFTKTYFNKNYAFSVRCVKN